MAEASLHEKQKLVSAHLSKDLRKKMKKRSVPVRKGDRIAVLRGKFKKKEGLVLRVNLGSLKIFVEGILLKKQGGKEKPAQIEPSNVVITQLVERKQRSKKEKVSKGEKKVVVNG